MTKTTKQHLISGVLRQIFDSKAAIGNSLFAGEKHDFVLLKLKKENEKKML